MSKLSITFRVPVVDKTKRADAGPFMNFRASDNKNYLQWPGCYHKHRTHETAAKCARSFSFGVTAGAVNERIETRSFARSSA